MKWCALALAGVALAAQPVTTTGITGMVVDALGGPVIAAKLSLHGQQTRLYVSKTSEQGHFRFARIEPGRYVLAIEEPGFCPLEIRDLAVQPGAELKLARIVLPSAPEGQNCP